MNSIPISRLCELLAIDPATGIVSRIRSKSPRWAIGSVVGSSSVGGYLETKIDGVRLLVHRVAFALYFGSWPKTSVDHINGVRTDNRPENLRELGPIENPRNVTKPHKGNSSGYLGVCWNKARGKWQSQICVDGKRRVIGLFDCAEMAHKAYCTEKRTAHQSWSGIANNQTKELL